MKDRARQHPRGEQEAHGCRRARESMQHKTCRDGRAQEDRRAVPGSEVHHPQQIGADHQPRCDQEERDPRASHRLEDPAAKDDQKREERQLEHDVERDAGLRAELRVARPEGAADQLTPDPWHAQERVEP